MITANQLLCHAIGDYLLQSHWMATEKTKRSTAAALHALLYVAPFTFLDPSFAAAAVIVGSHFVIDRWRLARFVVWAKNGLAPSGTNPPWDECRATGFPPETPAWLATWLLIIVDNTLHVLVNGAALRWL